MKNLGTKIEYVAKPVARTIDAIWGSDLANCGGCAKMRDNLNAGMSFWHAVNERFFQQIKGESNMQFQVMIIVEAESVLQAISPEVITKGTIIAVNPRPATPPQAGQQPAVRR